MRSSTRSRKSSLLVLILGLVVSLAACELGLRLIGAVQNLSHQRALLRTDANPAVIRILCLGNSYTFGSGAPPGQSFPDHLRNLLNERYGPNQFEVFNRGRPNANTSYITANLDQNLDETRPDIVILMAGEPNIWNKTRFKSRLTPMVSTDFLQTTYNFLYQFSLFRFGTLVWHEWQVHDSSGDTVDGTVVPDSDPAVVKGFKWMAALNHDTSGLMNLLTDEQKIEAVEALKKLLAQNPAQAAAAVQIAEIFYREHKVDLALNAIENVLTALGENFSYDLYDFLLSHKAPPPELPDGVRWQSALARTKKNAPDALTLARLTDLFRQSGFPRDASGAPLALDPLIEFLHLARKASPTHRIAFDLPEFLLKQGRIDEAANEAADGLLLNPMSAQFDFFELIGRIKKSNPSPQAKEKLDHAIAEFQKRFPSESYRLEAQDTEEVLSWADSDIRAIVHELKARRIQVVLQTYPPFRHPDNIPPRIQIRREIDDQIRKIAANEKIILSDTGRDLQDVLSASKGALYSNDTGPSDNHLNGEGYRLLSVQLLRRLEAESLISTR